MSQAALIVSIYSGVTAPVILGNVASPRESGAEGLTGDEDRNIVVVPIPRALRPRIFKRSNRTEGMTVRCTKLHANLGTALKWWLTHPSSVPEKADISFAQDGSVVWLNACGLSKVRRHSRPSGGLTTVFEYQIVGGSWGTSRVSPPT